jgi:hypothetical protein
VTPTLLPSLPLFPLRRTYSFNTNSSLAIASRIESQPVPNSRNGGGVSSAHSDHASCLDTVVPTGSPDRDGKKRKRSEYEMQIQIPAVLDSVDKKDEFAHFEQGYVLSEGSRRTRQGPVTPSRTDPTAVLPILPNSPERRATSSKKSHASVSVANEPPVNP